MRRALSSISITALVLSTSLVGVRATADDPKPAPRVVKGFMGFHVLPLSLQSAAQRAALGAKTDRATFVALVIAGGPAERAGMKVGDVLRRVGGQDVPEDAGYQRETPEYIAWRTKVRAILASVRAGEAVEVVVERGGKPTPLSIVPLDAAAMHRLQGGDDRPAPSLAEAGAAERFAVDFEEPPGIASEGGGLMPFEGGWKVVPEPGATANHALRQERTVIPWAALLVTGKGRACADGRARVRFRPLSGVVDASGGIAFRAQKGDSYYLARANALEDNLVLYVVRDGARDELASVHLTPPALDQWHTLEVVFEGRRLRATLDGRDGVGTTVEATDDTFASGWVGLWTKADSVTLFDDLVVEPAERTTK